MRSSLRALLFVVALLFSQHAAMLHGIAHAQRDIALASLGEGKAPKLDHDSDTCAAFGALGHALGATTTVQACERVESRAQVSAFQTFSVASRIAFDSRAPPLSS